MGVLKIFLTTICLVGIFSSFVHGDACSSTIPQNDRKDCYPWTPTSDLNAKCEKLGCRWCPSSQLNVPWCFYDNSEAACPSSIKPENRIDCHPQPYSSRDRCINKGCMFCESSRQWTPWCFYNGPKSGGNSCPTEIPENKRSDCLPVWLGLSPDMNTCIGRGCFWCPSQKQYTPWCFLDSRNWPEDNFNDKERIDCHPDKALDGKFEPLECIARGCRYRASSTPGAPWCFIPPEKGYKMIGSPKTTTKGYIMYLRRSSTLTLFGGDIDDVVVEVEFQTNERVRIKISDAKNLRFEVPLGITSPNSKASNPIYDVTFSNDPVFSFKIIRKATQTAVFDSSIGGLVMEDQFLQIATRLPSSKIYGFGMQEHKSYKHDLNWKTFGMWTRDQPPMEGANLYSAHPVYMGLENDGNAHGVLFLNANAQDVLLSPAPALTYRTTGGVLDLYVFLGPTPENVVQEYTEAVGRPFMPPYWSLGFSMAKYGYHTLQNMKETIARNRKFDIPHDYQFGDIDYMERRLDFTYDKNAWAGLPDYIEQLRKEGTRFIAILDPAIATGEHNYRPFTFGQQMDVWVKDSSGQSPAVGRVWPDSVVYYPDYTKQSTKEWWVTLCKEFKQLIDYDGLWIDMNEPANFVWGSTTGCADNSINKPPYYPKIWGPVLYYKTLCPDHKHHIGRHYDVHSLYGWSQAPPTLRATREATGKRSIVLSRSTFPGTGKYAATWLGDNWSYWSNMHYSIIGMLEFNLFGMPFVGADICGFIRDTNYNMCMRWHLLGAFYPFSRNHNLGYENRDQDPAVWGDNFAHATRKVLHIRYTLLPYLYTLFHKAHTQGSTVIRPLFHEFVSDHETHHLDRQFLWGPAFMVSPVIDHRPNQWTETETALKPYFPDARWYSYYDGSEGARKRYELLHVPWDFIPLHIRGGFILPTQQPANSTMFSRYNPMGLIVALDDSNSAKGDLFWDDGESLDTQKNGNYFFATFSVSNNELKSTIVKNGFSGMSNLKLNDVRVFGLPRSVTGVNVNGANHAHFEYNSDKKVLTVRQMDANANEELTVRW